ncbi:putative ribonuclease H-like domain-containing protein [Rosa chinensis]|uniref:Putative ribonuclease H-like domain-containing protein n=1 Tax=Rosa chinensis TaxID=74649 RepID=A0A2P6QM51_ROSCH|nr:putative ribonuclease H-like domain-containing protein [Rosa chinensis]
MNIDGALQLDQGVYGTGAVCRNDIGDCVGVLAVPGVGYVSPQTCEFLALVNGLHFCIQAGFSLVEIEGDAQNVFLALDSTQEDLSMDGALVDEAKVLFKSISVC